ncbi:MAG: hypothetical protein WCA81_02925 [Rhizomicrobium sp.]
MKFAVTSEDFDTVSGHAGKATRFLLFEAEAGREPVALGRLDLRDDQTIHSFQGDKHPLDGIEILITGKAGQCFIDRMAERGITTVLSPAVEAHAAVAAYLAGLLQPTTEADACSCHE